MLTDRQLKGLLNHPEAGRRVIWDRPMGRGAGRLGVRVSPRALTFIYMYSRRGKPRMATLGRYPALTLAEARAQAAGMAAALERGEDPAAALVEEHRKRREMPTITELAGEYLERWARPRKKSWRADQRILELDVFPAWGDWPADEVRRRDVRALLDRIARRAPIKANRTLEVIRKMFNWAVEEEILETNPCWQVRRPTQERPRERILTNQEIRALWQLLGRERGDGLEPELPRLWPGRPVRLALRLALVTAQRLGEISGAGWSEFDLDNGWWTIPGDRTKNGLTHRVPLPGLAMEIIEAIRESTKKTGWLLPSPKKGSVHPGALSRAVLRLRPALQIPHWTGHDLRRTAASGMASAGVPRLVISRVLNHVETGVTAVYDRHSYDQEKREALERWELRLREILA